MLKLSQASRTNTSVCAVIVAHPDDEILWAGGMILMNPQANWTVVSLCRKNDPDRSGKFHKVMEQLNAAGHMGDLDDQPNQEPQSISDVQKLILQLLPDRDYDLIITHDLFGEYTRNVRHEETARAVMDLWESQKLSARELWRFAYHDYGQGNLPRPISQADCKVVLPRWVWQKKYYLITKVYGFAPDSFEARTTPRTEAFWRFCAK